ncbi:rhomboid family intramembrane serine protease [Pontibacter sp. G13]|uniref:rhomboid family intramembrane serine protease n=1 Tax=Pontibacter sp. G13 TaxID=3074898 RepID=UPI00288B3A7B|nr:rhomboid family intramembrane serine protease [Pontibacter sp. G13]WNJ19597.1 rhomboid family intramembrane serine protease [Pontibacter sp. G13]
MIRLTPIVKHIIIVNVAIFLMYQIAQMYAPDLFSIMYDFLVLKKANVFGLFDPALYKMMVEQIGPFRPSQVVGWFWSHLTLSHIFWNMLGLAFIGPIVEQTVGSKRFLRFYLFCGVVGGLLVGLVDPSPYAVLGASGAISGVFAAMAFQYPDLEVRLYFLIPIKAKYLAIGFASISALLVIAGFMGTDTGNISHFGHLSGMIAAFLYYKLEKYMPILRQ